MSWPLDSFVPAPIREVLRGIGQIFFAENAVTGALFLLGVAASSPLMAAGLLIGSVIGPATARALKYDAVESSAGIYGFNSALVGIATLFFFRPAPSSFALLVGGCVVTTIATQLMRRHLPFPTYTTPFIVTTWALFLLGTGLGLARVEAGGPLVGVGFARSVAHGISQVMFQANVLTGLLFLIGVAIDDRRHASWVLVGSIVGALVANFHAVSTIRVLDPESLVERSLPETIALGLYGYNATLAAIALYLGKRSFIPPMLGILVSVPLTEFVPMLGLPALTAPFVLATWFVLGLARLEGRFYGPSELPGPGTIADSSL